MSAAILCDELLNYYRNAEILQAAENSKSRLESINTDYDALLKQMHSNSAIIERVASTEIGVRPGDANVIYPKASVEHLAAAQKAVAEDANKPVSAPVPDWLVRCNALIGVLCCFWLVRV